MALDFILVVAAVASLANGLAHNPPRSTILAESQDFDWQGWTPVPTTAPKSPHELVRRRLFELDGRELGTTILVAEDQTCGYLSGSAGAAYGCPGTSTCNFFPAVATHGFGAVGCCDLNACSINLYCINSVEYHRSSACGDVCEANTFTLKCTGSAEPFCNTAFYPDVSAEDVFCASRSVSSIQTISTNYRGQTFGGSFSAMVLTDSTSESASTSTSSTTTPTPTPNPVTPTPLFPSATTPTPGPTTSTAASSAPTPVGAIVGGAVGGIAVLALIGFGIWFILRKNRNKANANNQPQAPPPTYGPSEMGGGYAAQKPVVQTNQQGFYNPKQQQQQPVPIGGYFSPPLNPNNGLAPKPGEGFVGRDPSTSPISPELNRQSYVSAPGYDGSYPQGVHEVPGNSIAPRTR